jgi:hypothetical protein
MRLHKFWGYVKFILKWFCISIFGIVGTTAMLFYWSYKPPVKIEQQVCRPQTLDYALGNIDPRFNLKNEDILTVLKSSAQIWDEPLGYDILKYNPRADFKINFVYDERQKYEEKSKKYNEDVARLEQTYHGSVLKAKEKALLDNFNAYETKFNGGLKDFTQGEYRGNSINIFAFAGEEDLKILLAHEFGHAFGILDNQNPYSIMNGLANDNFPMVTSDDLKVVKELCVQS